MTGTRSQILNPKIKKETDDDKSMLPQLLQNSEGTMNSNGNKNSSTTTTSSKTRVVIPVSKVKQEDSNVKAELFSPKKEPKGPWITQEQINKLIDHIINDKMTTKEAAKKAGMCYSSALRYYRNYRNDRTRGLPLPRIALQEPGKTFTYEEVKKLIGYLVHDKMSIGKAAKKVNMSSTTALKYYSMYKADPNHNIPKPGVPKRTSTIETNSKRPTADQVKELINYVVCGKLTVTATSKKLGISRASAFKYYNRYLNDPEHKIPIPDKGIRVITDDQVKALISYIVNDNMSIRVASRKANMSQTTGKSYYQKYLNDPKSSIRSKRPSRSSSNDRLKLLISLIFKDKLKVKEAAKKVGISRGIAFTHYYKYIKDPSQYDFIPQVIFKDTNVRYKFNERLKKMFEYIVDDKMSLSQAYEKADIHRITATRYYKAYLNDPERKIPTQAWLGLSKEKINRVLSYLVHDKISIGMAAHKARISPTTAKTYYTKYMEYVGPGVSILPGDKSKLELPEDIERIFNDIHKKYIAEKSQAHQILEPFSPNPTT